MKLKAYLANSDIKIIDFAKKIGVSPNYLSVIMSGKAFPGKRLARDICEATGGIVKLPIRQEQQQQENLHTQNFPGLDKWLGL